MNQSTVVFKPEVSRVPISKDNERVYVTLPGEVVDKLREMAEKEMRTLSSMTAVMVIKGLEVTLQNDKNKGD